MREVGLTSFLLGINWGAGQYAWKSVAVLVPMLLGIVILFVFGFWGKIRTCIFSDFEFPNWRS